MFFVKRKVLPIGLGGDTLTFTLCTGRNIPHAQVGKKQRVFAP